MKKYFQRDRWVLRCGGCGGEIGPGESYWQLNGQIACGACLAELARAELEPFRRVRGEEETI